MDGQVFEINQQQLPNITSRIESHDRNPASVSTTNKPLPETAYQNPQKEVESAINSLFPTQAQETKVQQARRILKETGKKQTDEQIENAITEFEFLINDWLDEFEQKAFEGKTLRQLFTS